MIIKRQCFEDVGTRIKIESGEWVRSKEVPFFPLLKQVSIIGDPSTYLTKQWNECRNNLNVLIERGQMR